MRSLNLKTDMKAPDGKRYLVSTVSMDVPAGLIGYSHETMVFRYDDGEINGDRYCDRYQSTEEAEAGHARVVEALRAGMLDLYD